MCNSKIHFELNDHKEGCAYAPVQSFSCTGKQKDISHINFFSCSDFTVNLGLFALQIFPALAVFPVLVELLLLDSGCKNNCRISLIFRK